jgi:acetoin utilization deacetylase AcuC-like enzyme
MCHSATYLDLVKREVAEHRDVLSTGDAEISPASLDVARWACGGGMAAVDAVMAGKVDNAFVACRPPGHHAERDKGMGFCLFNNVAIAARYAQRKHGIKRVLIIDWDIHHGNGTQNIFYEDTSVFYCSIHQSPWYPGTGMKTEEGLGPARGTTLNFPLPAGSKLRRFQNAINVELGRRMQQFRPEFVLISAGFDAHDLDELGQFHLSGSDYLELTRMVCKLAQRYASNRVVSMLEGGYTIPALTDGVTHHIRGLLESSR